MSNPDSGKLSILISCYNQRDLIGEAIKSFFDQDYENREIIVLDDGSSDDSMAVIAEVAATAPCPVYFSTQQNRGPSYTFSRLAGLATGDYLLFMGGDDFVPANCLKGRMEKLAADEKLMFVCGLARYFYEDASSTWCSDPENAVRANGCSARTMLAAIKACTAGSVAEGIILPAAIIRRSDYRAAGGFSTGMKCDDSVLFYNLFSFAVQIGRKFEVLPELVFFYRQHAGNTCKNPEEMWVRFSELYTQLGFNTRRKASFSAYASYMQRVRQSGKWFQIELLKRIFADPAVIKTLTVGAICRDLLFPAFRRF